MTFAPVLGSPYSYNFSSGRQRVGPAWKSGKKVTMWRYSPWPDLIIGVGFLGYSVAYSEREMLALGVVFSVIGLFKLLLGR